jgi:CDGSH-type Zn-finger protein
LNCRLSTVSSRLAYSIHFHDEKYLLNMNKVLPNCGFGKRCINTKYGDNQPFCNGAHKSTSFEPLAFTAEKYGTHD